MPPDMGRLQHKCNRLRLLATCSIAIKITNKQNQNVIDYDYITLKVITITIAITFVFKHLQNENKPHLHGLMLVYFQTTYDINECNKRNY